MDINELVPDRKLFQIKQQSLKNKIEKVNLVLKSTEKILNDLEKTEKERKIKHLLDNGWRHFIFQSTCTDTEIFNIEVVFLFEKDSGIDKFNKLKFSHSFGTFQKISFSKRTATYIDDNFKNFLKWFNALETSKYTIIEEKI